MVSPIPGTTRDAVDSLLVKDGKTLPVRGHGRDPPHPPAQGERRPRERRAGKEGRSSTPTWRSWCSTPRTACARWTPSSPAYPGSGARGRHRGEQVGPGRRARSSSRRSSSRTFASPEVPGLGARRLHVRANTGAGSRRSAEAAERVADRVPDSASRPGSSTGSCPGPAGLRPEGREGRRRSKILYGTQVGAAPPTLRRSPSTTRSTCTSPTSATWRTRSGRRSASRARPLSSRCGRASTKLRHSLRFLLTSPGRLI